LNLTKRVRYEGKGLDLILKITVLQDILKQAMEDNLQSAAELPYFEGDFWPNVLEESIKELDQEEEEKRKLEEAEAAAAADTVVDKVRCGSFFFTNVVIGVWSQV